MDYRRIVPGSRGDASGEHPGATAVSSPEPGALLHNQPMRSARAVLSVCSLASLAGIAAVRVPERARSAVGLDMNWRPGAPAAEQARALEEVRRTGVDLFALTLSWSAAEPSPGKYRLAEITRTARLLRQSGALLHLDVPLVAGRVRDVPADLANNAFDDPKLSIRLGRLFDALDPALLDLATISLGYEADAYFEDKPEELKAYRRLFDGAVAFLGRKAPHVKVGVTTMAPTESRAPLIAAALHQRSPVLFFLYAPFERGAPYRHRSPRELERDWRLLLERSAGRPIAFPEVSFSSDPANASSPEKQAEFVRGLRRFLASADGERLLFARYASWRDVEPGPPVTGETPELALRRTAFYGHRGLCDAAGKPKPAWREWEKGR